MKIEATRRRFLAFVGVAAPAAPLVAKAAVEKEMAALSGVKLGANVGVGIPYSGIMDAAAPGSSGGIDVWDAADKFFSVFGMPEHIKENFVRRSREINAIDPDIAVKRSWSFAVKVQAQRERNLEKMQQGMVESIAQTRREKAFRKLTGFSWPFYC